MLQRLATEPHSRTDSHLTLRIILHCVRTGAGPDECTTATLTTLGDDGVTEIESTVPMRVDCNHKPTANETHASDQESTEEQVDNDVNAQDSESSSSSGGDAIEFTLATGEAHVNEEEDQSNATALLSSTGGDVESTALRPQSSITGTLVGLQDEPSDAASKTDANKKNEAQSSVALTSLWGGLAIGCAAALLIQA